MGNIVNQYIAANTPNIENLNKAINDLTVQLQNTGDAIKSAEATRSWINNSETSVMAAIRNVWGGSPIKKYNPNITEEQIAAGNFPFAAFSSLGPWVQQLRDLSNQWLDLQARRPINDNLLAQLTNTFIEIKKSLAEKRALLQVATENFNKGLADAQAAEVQAANQESINKVNESQSTNPEIIKIRQEADLAKTVAATEAAAKQKNVQIIVIAVAVVLIVGAIIYGLVVRKS